MTTPNENDIIDLFVIGGGINGCGIARDAAGRGFRVELAEMNDLAAATSSASIGLIAGLALAVILGYMIYNRSIKLNLSKFFTVTGIALIIVAAGVLSYGVHEYQELGWIPGDGSYAWDISSIMAKDSIAGTILAGTIGFDVNTSWVQLFLYASYLAIVLRLYTKSSPAKTLVK